VTFMRCAAPPVKMEGVGGAQDPLWIDAVLNSGGYSTGTMSSEAVSLQRR